MENISTSQAMSDDDVVILEHWETSAENSDKLSDILQTAFQKLRKETNLLSCFYLLREKTKDGEHVLISALGFQSSKNCASYLRSNARSDIHEKCEAMGLLLEPVKTQQLRVATGFLYRETGPYSAAGIHVAFAKIDYAPGKRDEGIGHWDRVAKSVHETETIGTYTYCFLVDAQDENALYSLERYRDESYLWDVHVPSDAIQGNIKNQKDIRTGLLLRQFESVESGL